MGIIMSPIAETLMIYDRKTDPPVAKVMGLKIRDFYPEKDEERDKLELLVRMIRYDRK